MDNISGKRDFKISIPNHNIGHRRTSHSQTCEVPDIGCKWSMSGGPLYVAGSNVNKTVFSFIIQVDKEKFSSASRFEFCVTADITANSYFLATYDSGWQAFVNESTTLKMVIGNTPTGHYISNLDVNATLSLKPCVKPSPDFVVDIPSMLGDNKYSDFTFIVGKKHFKVHKNILGFTSEVFDKLFTSEMGEKHNNQCKIDHIKPGIFENLLSFIYGGELPENLDAVAMKLFEAAHYYRIEKLTEICWRKIHSTLTKENAVKIFEWASLYEQKELMMASWIIVKRDILEITSEMQQEPLSVPTIQRLINDKNFFESLKKKP